MTSDALANEAIGILDAEAARRIDEIRQNVDFICSSLRAQGNMTINELLQSVRTLTMDEFCNKYHADTSYFLEEQSKKRKGTELKAPRKKRVTDVAPPAFSSDQIPRKTKESQVRNAPPKLPLKKDRTKPSIKPTQTNLQQQRQQQQPKNSLHHHQLQEPQLPQQSQPPQQPAEIQQPQNQHNGLSDEALTNGKQMAGNGNVKLSDEKSEEGEVEFGPLFMQFLRPGHVKVKFQLDPQEELNQLESYQLQIPYEFVDQFGPGHRRRIIDQVQHIENQLEAFKQRLLHPPSSRSISPSSPSPSL